MPVLKNDEFHPLIWKSDSKLALAGFNGDRPSKDAPPLISGLYS